MSEKKNNKHHVKPKSRKGKRKNNKKILIPKSFHDAINIVFENLYEKELIFFVRGVAFLSKKNKKLLSKDLKELRSEIKSFNLNDGNSVVKLNFRKIDDNFNLPSNSPVNFHDSWNLIFNDLCGKETEIYIKKINEIMVSSTEITWDDITEARNEIKKLDLNNKNKGKVITLFFGKYKLPIKKPSFMI